MRLSVSNIVSQTAFFSPRRNVWKRVPRSLRGRVLHGVFLRVRAVLSAFGVIEKWRGARALRVFTLSFCSPAAEGFVALRDPARRADVLGAEEVAALKDPVRRADVLGAKGLVAL